MTYDIIADYLGVLEKYEIGEIDGQDLENMLADEKNVGMEELEDFYKFLKGRLGVGKSLVTNITYVGFKRKCSRLVWLDKKQLEVE